MTSSAFRLPQIDVEHQKFEIWHDGTFIGTVAPLDDGAGVQLITEHEIDIQVSKAPNKVQLNIKANT